MNVAADDAAQKKIGDARTRLLAGEDFGKVAGEVSESASKANGGLIGPFSRDDMSPQLQQLLDKMKPGDITPAIRTPRGYPDPQARNAQAAARAAVRQASAT